ncbi:TPA: symmetrical bis(5'-nucleosyl)-tetraphosphatase [Legionella pneumophila]|uniref:symmetrical bis(5'-nucleosyl)-tetraphosphatase n=1 Tax=Legionella sp. PATHC039 TaxID=2992042 RepID=UPI0007785D7E|nr:MULTISPECIES: symmetrical bis(5'-nucleosyl)-tetraphosphatase [Legionella]MCW8396449.1 symmetrical bis(5'-nucleosyl)-tetraphosphatase [Legionella sp. PATHC039]HCJ1102497.1 symmetrical bis(5'-nucleosyl)-tetraphosphatase [Legionella pneumophila]HCJ1111899.1 symmetrical bis(5'-nucleosyl)-tetraphosphatase [Legionella pneumophila]HCJ1115090.1 symmetrical bis(5'-nucleosyl)-tetraphosphatase [Legionella pneumophila]HCU6013393.1 symmetrical bis(5'-nucleosyl)-tetraphosphatase [Legionella pneumophila]
MPDYAIGDVQGCYDPLQRLLELIDFNEKEDCLWFVGDLVNRGPDSLAVLRFIYSLPVKPKITLGNHDLHLLGLLFGGQPWKGHDDTLEEVMLADDGEELGHWLRKQSLLCRSSELNLVMCHAGIAPLWDLSKTVGLANELEAVLSGDSYHEFFAHMYGNKPDIWSDGLVGLDRLRVITNYFTRMRYCDAHGRLDFGYKGTLSKAPNHLYPWFEVPCRKEIEMDIVFGHWAALMGQSSHPRIHAIDTGCLWGGQLTALRLQDRQRFSVPGYGVNHFE